MTLVDNSDSLFVNEPRYILGMKLFNSCDWYRAHDVFEEIWHETIGPERQTLQGILQIAVAQVHLANGNTNGATILYGEALGRLRNSRFDSLGLDISELCKIAATRLNYLQNGKDLSTCSIPFLDLLISQ
tara:strand:+ start:201 stop:590 length:390 start_codon:yes stop_codon:yes gene_type:complete